MATTTIRIPEKLKERGAFVTERTGKSTHGFILEAISEKAEFEEQGVTFVETAERRYDAIVVSGKTLPWAERHEHLERRVAGEVVPRPKP